MKPASYIYPVHKISISDNIELVYTKEGEGTETIVFIHGLANYLPVWNLQFETLKNNCNCIALDLPGNGMSPGGNFPHSMVFYAETVYRFIEKLNLKNVTIAGHSMGGHIAVILALRYPEMIKKLILVAPSGLEQFTTTEIMLTDSAMEMGQIWGNNNTYIESAIHQSFFSKNPYTEPMINDLKDLIKSRGSQWHQMIVANIRSMMKEPVTEFLHALSQHTILIFGAQDAMIPNRLVHFNQTTSGIAQKAAKQIENCELHVLQNAGHFVQIEQHQKVNELIHNFVIG